jgi:hypothetical protein
MDAACSSHNLRRSVGAVGERRILAGSTGGRDKADDDVVGGIGLIGHDAFLSSMSADETSLGRCAPAANH